MARLLVLTDRSPNDAEWKGALAWKIILSLAESHHEVLVVTPLDLQELEFTHPRLTIARPLDSWGVQHMPKLAQLVLQFRPEVIHTFALRPSRIWPALTVWPYLNSISNVQPDLRRFSTLFEPLDHSTSDPSFVWHRGSSRITVFAERHQRLAARALGQLIELLPLEWDDELPSPGSGGVTLIPAPVSEWQNPIHGIQLLAVFLARHPEISVRIVGGWGDWKAQERKTAWEILGNTAARVELTSALNFSDFTAELNAAQALWLDPLRRDSWRFMLALEWGGHLDKHIYLSSPSLPMLTTGSTANFLSRLYSTPLRRGI